MKTRIIDIKRFAVHDGPGICTTIFLKGCSLKCKWCHNPESITSHPEIAILKNKCSLCKECFRACPRQAHYIDNGLHCIDRKKCNACGKCVSTCLENALIYYGLEFTAEALAELVLEDRNFHFNSGGGLTLSGGEPLLQPEFCLEIFKIMKRNKINCYIDTSGMVSWSNIEMLLPFTDMFLYDLKHTDDAMHREYTGASNRLILENLRRISKCGKSLEIRIPVIPGFNDDETTINSFGELLSGISGISAVRLLPYHEARSKYDAIGKRYAMPSCSIPSRKKMDEIAERLSFFNLCIKK